MPGQDSAVISSTYHIVTTHIKTIQNDHGSRIEDVSVVRQGGICGFA